LGGTLIKSTHPGDPLGAAAPTGIWLTRGNDKDQWLASELCELALEILGIVARRNRDYWKAAKGRGNTPHKFTNHNTARGCVNPQLMFWQNLKEIFDTITPL